MSANKLAYHFAELQVAKVSLSKDFVRAFAKEAAVRCDHVGHLACGRDEAANIMEQGTNDCLLISACLLGEGGSLKGMLKLCYGFAQIVSVALGFQEGEQLGDDCASGSFHRRKDFGGHFAFGTLESTAAIFSIVIFRSVREVIALRLGDEEEEDVSPARTLPICFPNAQAAYLHRPRSARGNTFSPGVDSYH
jgi:hypothetical protein